MSKNKHHFVSKFYLNAFKSAEKQIHLFNLKRLLAIKNASIRDQCYRHKFYGYTDETENYLSILENHIAPLLKSIIQGDILPIEGTEAYYALIAFVSLQLLRTPLAAERINTSIDKMTKQAYSRDPRFSDLDKESFHFGYKDPVLASLKNLPLLLYSISDLKAQLVVSTARFFLTSDNPAFKYNQYCEDISYAGITGGLCRGLQIFIPLAPNIYLVLYDSTVYKVERPDRISRVSNASLSDIETLNEIQLISANQNVYFSDYQQLQEILRLIPLVKRQRASLSTVVKEYGQDDNPNSSLLHTYHSTPCLKLNLSFLKIKRRARRIKPKDRVNDYRKAMPTHPLPEPPDLKGRTVTFSRFLGQR